MANIGKNCERLSDMESVMGRVRERGERGSNRLRRHPWLSKYFDEEKREIERKTMTDCLKN